MNEDNNDSQALKPEDLFLGLPKEMSLGHGLHLLPPGEKRVRGHRRTHSEYYVRGQQARTAAQAEAMRLRRSVEEESWS